MHFHQFIVTIFFIILMRTWVSLWSGKAICWFLNNANNVALTGTSNLPSHLNNSFSSQKMFALRTTCNFFYQNSFDFLKSIVINTFATRYYQQKIFFIISFFYNFFFRLFTNLLTHEVTLNSSVAIIVARMLIRK